MLINRIFAVACLAAALGGCAAIEAPPEGRLAAACQAYADTLSALADVRGEMTAAQVAIVNDARGVAGPICARGSEYGDAQIPERVAIVADAVADMTKVEGEVDE